jgi:hypothetical protein
VNRQPVSGQIWDGIRAEFTLPALEQVRRRLCELMEDPEPVMQQLVRVFIDDGTFCPGFQFLPGGQLHPTVPFPAGAGAADPAQLLHGLDGHPGADA